MAVNKNIKKILLLFCALLFTIVLALFVLEKLHIINLYNKPESKSDSKRPVNSVNYSPPNPSDNNDINQAKQNGSLVTKPTTRPITVTLTRVYQDTNKNLIIRTLIEGQNSGTCKLELTKNSDQPSLTKESEISQQNNIFVCNGFDIAESEFPSFGEWTVKLTVTGGGTTDSTSQNIVLEK